MTSGADAEDTRIAVVGMAGRFPGAPDCAALWRSLLDGVDSVRTFSQDELAAAGIPEELRTRPDFVAAGGRLDGPELFDADFFAISWAEADVLDPQHRLLLECAWEAMEDAGQVPDHGSRTTGVFVGVDTSTYLTGTGPEGANALRRLSAIEVKIASDKDFAPTRISHRLDLRGPSVNVNSACSSSLVAVHLSCQSLLAGECDVALAGGAGISFPIVTGYLYESGGLAAADGRCRTFDAAATGLIGAHGAAVVVLRRLEDALRAGDRVRAVILGSAINNDGAARAGYTTPSADGQTRVIRDALAAAGVDAGSIGYIEAHGTGTPVGDPIEVRALTRAFRRDTDRRGFCALGSLKTNVGHLGHGAGAASLIKAVLAIEAGCIPGNLHFVTPNPDMDLDESPFFVPVEPVVWPAGGLRRAGVSSFGLGGTNAHVVLEQAPPAAAVPPPARPVHVLTVSARSHTALRQVARNVAGWLDANSGIPVGHVAGNLHLRRVAMPHRLAVACTGSEAGAARLRAAADRLRDRREPPSPAPVVFLFPGTESFRPGLGATLRRDEPAFRAHLDELAAAAGDLAAFDVTDAIDAGAGAAPESQAAVLAGLFAAELALALTLLDWGLRPAAVLGHSLGEYVAATVAGVLRPRDAFALVLARGRLMDALPAGAMLSLALTEGAAREMIRDRPLWLAAVNTPAACVVSGREAAVRELEAEARAAGIDVRPVNVAVAAHSGLLDAVLPTFAVETNRIDAGQPEIPYPSNVDGRWVDAERVRQPGYWADHLRRTVRFADCMRTIERELPGATIVEVGPGHTAGPLARQNLTCGGRVLRTMAHPRDVETDAQVLAGSLADLWAGGHDLDWQRYHDRDAREPSLALPAYPFERRRHWPGRSRQDAPIPVAVAPPPPELSAPADLSPANGVAAVEAEVRAIWRELLGCDREREEADFYDLGGDSLIATRITNRLRARLGVALPIQLLLDDPFVTSLVDAVRRQLARP